MAEHIPDANDPKRDWKHIGGDLEASYDGARYVDIRPIGKPDERLFLSQGALEEALKLFDPPPLAR